MHRSEATGRIAEPEGLASSPEGIAAAELQRHDDGYGPLFHRRYQTRMRDCHLAPEALMDRITRNLNKPAPSSFARFQKFVGEAERVALGDGYVVRMPEAAARDLVLFTAPEPNLRWRTYTSTLLDVFQKLGTETLVSFGAVLAPVHHRASPPMRGWATTDALRTMLRRRSIGSGRYEGPTGITTVLLAAARERGLASFSLSTSSPSYLTDMPNPRASAALLRMTSGHCGQYQ